MQHLIAHRLRVALTDKEDLSAGPVEVDETYIGGKRKNMSLAKREELKGAVGKEAVVGVKDRETNQVTARHVQHTDSPHLAGFVAKKTKLGAKVHADEAKAYKALDSRHDHEAVNYGVGGYVRDLQPYTGMLIRKETCGITESAFSARSICPAPFRKRTDRRSETPDSH